MALASNITTSEEPENTNPSGNMFKKSNMLQVNEFHELTVTLQLPNFYYILLTTTD